jgi:hypothetical protein
MFSLFSLRRVARSAFILLVMLFLSSAFLLIGCKDEPDPVDDQNKLNQNLIGTWASEYDDIYAITAVHLSYDDGFGGGYAGAIKYVSNFTSTAGVIIIEYDAGHKPRYYDNDFNPVIPPKGDFVGIYYENLVPGVSVKIAQAIDLSDYTGAEETTLDAAKNAFTSGKKGDYISVMGTYLWQ